MKLIRRLIAWSFFVGFLAAFGTGAYYFVRYRPRCTIETSQVVEHVSADGRYLVTCFPHFTAVDDDPPRDEQIKLNHGLLQFWDTSNGRIVRSFEVDAPIAKSADGRLFASLQQDGALQVMDWRCGDSWSLAMKTRGEEYQLAFSPKGRWLWVCPSRTEWKSVIIDTSTRRISHEPQLKHWNLVFSKDERYAFWTADLHLHVLNLRDGRTQIAAMATPSTEAPFESELQALDGKWVAYCIGKQVQIWDLETVRCSRHFDRFSSGHWHCDLATITGGSLFAQWEDHGQRFRLEIASLSDGERRLLHSDDDAHPNWKPSVYEYLRHGTDCQFSPDGSLLLVSHDSSRLRAFDAVLGRMLWMQSAAHGGIPAYSRISSYFKHVLWVRDAFPSVQLFDARTGERVSRLDDGFCANLFDFESHHTAVVSSGDVIAIRGEFAISPEGTVWRRWLTEHFPRLFPERQRGILVVDASKGCELHRLRLDGFADLYLSDDGGTLVTCWNNGNQAREAAPTIQVWDVHPDRAYLWGVTTSLTVGAFLLLLRRWRLQRKAARKAAWAA